MTPTALLRLYRDGPWRAWLGDTRLRLVLDAPLLVATDRVMPWRGEPVDGVVTLTDADLDAMLAGRAPKGPIQARLGDRERPDRLKQAGLVLGLANLGWCGPWPDPAVDPEHVRLVRDALWELEVGPADAVRPLFAAGAPGGLDRVALRLTDGATRTAVTCGLAELVGAELHVRAREVPVRLLRTFALDAVEHGRVAASLDGVAPRFRPLPLPHASCALAELTP